MSRGQWIDGEQCEVCCQHVLEIADISHVVFKSSTPKLELNQTYTGKNRSELNFQLWFHQFSVTSTPVTIIAPKF